MNSDQTVVLIGGPRDQSRVSVGDEALLEIEIDGLLHRYIRTHQSREVDGDTLPVYNYDGVVDPELTS